MLSRSLGTVFAQGFFQPLMMRFFPPHPKVPITRTDIIIDRLMRDDAEVRQRFARW